MSAHIAALQMYDWPEIRAGNDARWLQLRNGFRQKGIDVPEHLVRCNADMSPVPGGIRDAAGGMVAPDPATLPPDELDYHTLWRHPSLLFGQTCWGPMELGLSNHVQVVGQPNYDDFEGGQGINYSSAIVMRCDDAHVRAPVNGSAVLPVTLMRGKRLAFNGSDSMSGIIALTRDLELMGEDLAVFSERIESGGHRASVVMVAAGNADVAAIDCKSWVLAQRYEPAARALCVIGWTAQRKGLPYISAATTPAGTVAAMREVLTMQA